MVQHVIIYRSYVCSSDSVFALLAAGGPTDTEGSMTYTPDL